MSERAKYDTSLTVSKILLGCFSWFSGDLKGWRLGGDGVSSGGGDRGFLLLHRSGCGGVQGEEFSVLVEEVFGRERRQGIRRRHHRGRIIPLRAAQVTVIKVVPI